MVVGAASEMPAIDGKIDLLTRQDLAGQWMVLHTLSRQEQALARDLSAWGVPYFLPMTRSVRYYGRRKTQVTVPLFPGYLFMKGELDDAYRADRTRRVAQIIQVPDQDRLLTELSALERVVTGGGELEPHPYLKVDTWVEVTSGPFKGAVGLVDEVNGTGRLILRVQTLGQAASLEIDAALLTPLEQQPPEAGITP